MPHTEVSSSSHETRPADGSKDGDPKRHLSESHDVTPSPVKHNINPTLGLATVLCRIVAIAAKIDTSRNPDRERDGWLKTAVIFNFFQEDNPYLSMFSYSGRLISVLHLVYALLKYGMQPNALGLDLFKRLLKHKRLRDLFRGYFRMGGQPTSDQDLLLQLKIGNAWPEVAATFFGDGAFVKELKKWSFKYFSELLIPMVAARGTPSSNGQESENRTQDALRELCLKRDGHMTVVGRVWNRFWPKDTSPPAPSDISDYDQLKACHIMPYCSSESPNFCSHLVLFTGDPFLAESIGKTINAFMLPENFHASFRRFEWCIQTQPDAHGRFKYYFRKFNHLLPRHLDQHGDWEEVFFGANDMTEQIPIPNPHFLNACTALAKIANASGTAEIIDSILRDEDDIRERGCTARSWGRVGQNYLMRELQRLSIGSSDDLNL